MLDCVRVGHGDILKQKPQLWQLMGAVKKFKGQAEAKHPVTLAMLMVIHSMLDLSTDYGVIVWAAVTTAFHFMMRSSEYLAKLSAGRFDLDRVLRAMDVAFYRQGVVTTDYTSADEVRLTWGKQKTSAGGEIRSMKACGSEMCVVKALATMFSRIHMHNKRQPLFSWPDSVTMPGHGVRYTDMLDLMKLAAERCGRDTTKFGTHSLRRGGACAYLSSGATLEQLCFHGRWAPGSRAPIAYVQEGVGMLLGDMQAKVLRGDVAHAVLERAPPRERVMRQFEVSRAMGRHFPSSA